MKIKHFILLATLPISINSINAFSHAQCLAKSTNYSIYKDSYVNAKADYITTIQNNTLLPQSYTVIATLCPENKQCKEVSHIVQVAQRGFYDQKFKLEQGVTYRNTGVFRLLATVRIIGESNSLCQDNGSITVYKKPD